MGNDEHLKEQVLDAYRIVKGLDMETDYKVQAFAVVLSYFLACT